MSEAKAPAPEGSERKPAGGFEIKPGQRIAAAGKLADPTILTALLKEKLTPGEHPAEPLSLYGVGKCDGIFYLGDGISEVALPNGDVACQKFTGFYKQAMRYLRPMSKGWHARMDFHGNGRRVGISKPSVGFLITQEMLAVSKKHERPIEWIFNCEQHCIDAVQAEHRDRWHIFPVSDIEPEGIWAVLYI